MKSRKKYINNIRRVVVKIGSSSLTSEKGGLDTGNMLHLVKEVKDLTSRGIEVVLVSSGAMAAGLKYMGIKKNPRKTPLHPLAPILGRRSLCSSLEQFFETLSLRLLCLLRAEHRKCQISDIPAHSCEKFCILKQR